MKKKLSILILIISLNLILLLNSCISTQSSNIHLDFPTFPDPIIDNVSVVKYNPETDEVTMPRFYWIAITKYEIDVNTLKNIYEEFYEDN